MRKLICFFVLFASIFLLFPNSIQAASQDECAIWLCLPGGFPEGCSGAYKAFKHRLKKKKPPLPSFSSCALDGEGHYELGYETYHPCDEGYSLLLKNGKGLCVNMSPECTQWQQNPEGASPACEAIQAIRRTKPNFVKMWANGEYIGQFWY